MKRYLIVMTLIATMFMFGCATFDYLTPTLSVYPGSTTGDISFTSEEHVVRFSVSGSTGIINVDFGDESVGSTGDGEGIVWFEHAYSKVGVYTAKFSRNGAVSESTVTITAPGFEVYTPRGAETKHYKYEFVEFTLLPRRVGCDNETDDMVYHGIFPDDSEAYIREGVFGDVLSLEAISEDFEMYVRVLNSDGTRGYAYSSDGDLINNKWVTVQQFGLFVNWRYAAQYAPLSSVSPKSVCAGEVEATTPIDEDTPFANVQVGVRNRRGIESQIHWPVYFYENSCE